MEKKKTGLVIGIIAIVLTLGVSFAYFIASTNTGTGVGNVVDDTTTKVGDTTLKSEEFLKHNDSNIYPGHKSVSAIKVTATGVNETLFNITWTGTNTIGTPYKYTIYKTTSEQNPTFSCEVKQELIEGVGNTYHEECTSTNISLLGEALVSGTIEEATEAKTIKLLRNQKLQATQEGAIVYYYVIFEFPNIDEGQNTNGKLDGTINTQILQSLDSMTMDEILAEYNISTRTDFSTVYTEETTKTVFTAEDGLGTSKYFAGAPTDNYVKFGGFYWRIIRMNGDKTTRLIYAGDAGVIDALGNKQEVLANGYDDSSTKYTQIKVSKFNSSKDDNAYVGLKYKLGSLRGLEEKSTILEELDTWYETNLKTNYGKYIDESTGFCGDRTAYTDEVGTTIGGGTDTTKTFYADNIRLYINKSPVLTCANSADLYTTSGASRGNKTLTNPVGLINANEVAFAGGVYRTDNASYYLYTNKMYWTMSPYNFSNGAQAFHVSFNGSFANVLVDGGQGVRPVINLASSTRFLGSGTWNDPFIVVES